MKDDQPISPGFPSPITRVHKGNVEAICKQAIDYAIDLHLSYRSKRVAKITKAANSYLGYASSTGKNYLNKTYGPDNTVQYIDYKMTKKKIDLLAGEWLKTPLNSTVYATNESAKSGKFDNLVTLNSIKNHREHIEKMRNVAGVPVFQGIDTNMSEKTIESYMSAKTRNEMIAQFAINDYINRKSLRSKFYPNLMNLLIGAESYGKTYIDANGNVNYRPIDIRLQLVEESENDPFCENTQYMGEERPMFLHQILHEYPDLKPEEVSEIESWSLNGSSAAGTSSMYTINQFILQNGKKNHLIQTYTIEFLMFEAYDEKVASDKKDPNKIHRSELSPDYYLKNAKKLKRGEDKGLWKIETKYRPVLYEATRIGPTIYTNLRKKPNVIASINDPTRFAFSYTCLHFNTINGERISIQESMEEIKEQYNIVRFMINREMVKSKGLVITYDRAFLPKDKKGNPIPFEKILYKMVNDGVYDYDSSAEGFDGDANSVATAIKVHDLSISKSLPMLIQLAQELEHTADVITGINNDRQGNTPASSTATNAINNQNNSNSVTTPLMFFFSEYCEKVMMKIIEYTKISWCYLHPDRGQMTIGDENMGYLKVTEEFSDDDYNLYLSDGTREMNIRRYMRETIIPNSLAAATLAPQYALASEMATTLGEANATLEKGWDIIEKAKQLQADQAAKSQQAQQQQALAAQDEIEKKRNAHEIGAIIVKEEAKKNLQADKLLADYALAEQEGLQQQVNTVLSQNPEQ